MLKKQNLWLAGSNVFIRILSFIAIKLNIMTFGTETLGNYFLILSLWGVGSNIDFGIGFSMIKLIGEKRNEDCNNLTPTISTGFVVLLLLSIVIYAILWIVGQKFYISNFNESTLPKSELLYIFYIMSFAFLIRYLGSFFRSVLDGFDNYISTSKIDMASNVLLFIGSYAVFLYKLSIVSLAYVYLISGLIISIATFILYKIKIQNYEVVFASVSVNNLKNILKISYSVQVMNLAGGLIDPVFKYIIGNYYRVDSVTIYETARRFSNSVFGLFYNTFKNLLTEISQLKHYEEKKNFLLINCQKISKLSVAFTSIMFGIGSLFVAIISKYMFDNTEIATVFLYIALYDAINCFALPYWVFLAGTGSTILLSITQIINLLVSSFALFIGFVVFGSNLGFIGPFIAVLILNIYLLFVVSRKYSFSAIKYFLNASGYKFVILSSLILLSALQQPEYNLYSTALTAIIVAIYLRNDLKFIGNLRRKKI